MCNTATNLSVAPQTVQEAVTSTRHVLSSLDATKQLQVLSSLYQSYALNYEELLIPMDYLPLSIKAMMNLRNAGRSNVLYNCAKAVGTTRPDGSDTLLPVKRLRMGLLEHCVTFFTATSIGEVQRIA